MDNNNLLSDLLTFLGTDPQDTTTSLNLESLSPHHHYQPSSFPESLIIGNPQAEMSRWHLQETEDSCGVAAQQFGIENITNQNLSESQLRVEAEANGWYQQGVGTPVEDFGKLLAEQAHVPVESHFGGTIAEIEQKIIQGEEVFVGVNSLIEWLPDKQSLLGQVAPNLFDPHNFAGQPANHIVQVAGLEINSFDPQHSYVIVNDSSSPDGRGVEIPIDQFQQAMEASQGYIASTAIHDSPNIRNSSNLLTTDEHSITFRGCDNFGFDEDRKNFYVDGHVRGHCNGRSFYTDYAGYSGTYKGCVGKDLYIYDSSDTKVGYLDSCGRVHNMSGDVILGSGHSGFANAAYYLLSLLG